MDVLCDGCPGGGVGIYNPGFWRMNIEQGKKYKFVGPLCFDDNKHLTNNPLKYAEITI
ncbi:unnamed protein product [Rhodiola kirilowii]